jgi:hypothetical protein
MTCCRMIRTAPAAEGESLEVLTSHGVRVMAEKLLKDTDLTGYDVLILPGGKLDLSVKTPFFLKCSRNQQLLFGNTFGCL